MDRGSRRRAACARTDDRSGASRTSRTLARRAPQRLAPQTRAAAQTAPPKPQPPLSAESSEEEETASQGAWARAKCRMCKDWLPFWAISDIALDESKLAKWRQMMSRLSAGCQPPRAQAKINVSSHKEDRSMKQVTLSQVGKGTVIYLMKYHVGSPDDETIKRGTTTIRWTIKDG